MDDSIEIDIDIRFVVWVFGSLSVVMILVMGFVDLGLGVVIDLVMDIIYRCLGVVKVVEVGINIDFFWVFSVVIEVGVVIVVVGGRVIEVDEVIGLYISIVKGLVVGVVFSVGVSIVIRVNLWVVLDLVIGVGVGFRVNIGCGLCLWVGDVIWYSRSWWRYGKDFVGVCGYLS